MKHALLTMLGLAALTLSATAQQTSRGEADAPAVPHVEAPEGSFQIALPGTRRAPSSRDSSATPPARITRAWEATDRMRSVRGLIRLRRAELAEADKELAADSATLALALGEVERALDAAETSLGVGEAPRVLVAARVGEGGRAEGVARAPRACRAVVRIVTTDGDSSVVERRVVVVSGDSTVLVDARPDRGGRGLHIRTVGPRTHMRRNGASAEGGREVVAFHAEVAGSSGAHVVIVEPGESAPAEAPVDQLPEPIISEYTRPEPPLPSAVEMLEAAHAGYSLSSPTPNPVGTAASISFTLPQGGPTRLAVFDNAGRVVATLVDENLDAGAHARTFDASGLPAGLYLYRLSSGSYAETKTMTVVR